MKKVVNYIKGAFEEVIHKVSWPKLSELQNTTVLVLVASVIFSLIVLGIDKVFQMGVGIIYNM